MRLLHAACAATSLLIALAAHGQATTTMGLQSDTGRTVISATGQARQTMTPDRATLMIMIDAQAMSADESATRLTTIERAVMDTLRRFNLAGGAIQSFNSGVVPNRQQNLPPSMSGGRTFSGRSVIRVELARVDQISGVTSAALAKGAAYITPPIFSSSNADSVRRVLLPRALESAQRDAEVLARAAGGHLGRLIDVSAPVSQPNPFSEQNQQVYFNSMYFDSGPRPAPTSAVSTTVTARWVLVPNR
jgi:uncharacterized protein YggE